MCLNSGRKHPGSAAAPSTAASRGVTLISHDIQGSRMRALRARCSLYVWRNGSCCFVAASKAPNPKPQLVVRLHAKSCQCHVPTSTERDSAKQAPFASLEPHTAQLVLCVHAHMYTCHTMQRTLSKASFLAPHLTALIPGDPSKAGYTCTPCSTPQHQGLAPPDHQPAVLTHPPEAQPALAAG